VLNKKFNKTKKPYKSLTKLVEEVLVSEYATVLIQKENEPDVTEYKVSNTTADKIKKALSADPHYEKINAYIISKGFKPDTFQRGDFQKLITTIFESNETDLDAFSKFIDSQSKPSLIENTAGNLIRIGNSHGLPTELLTNIFNTKLVDDGGNSVGPGEILLGLLFKDLRNSETVGDLMLGNDKVEVKGDQGRFGPQPGRGEIIAPVTSFVAPFLARPEQQQQYTALAANIKVPGVASKDANFDMIKHMFASYDLIQDKKAVYDNTVKVLDSIYNRNEPVAANYITQAMIANKEREKIKKALIKINTVGYLGDEKLIIMNPSHNYIFATKENMISSGGLIDQDKIKTKSNFKFNDAFPNLILK
jgi:hypothetical protein